MANIYEKRIGGVRHDKRLHGAANGREQVCIDLMAHFTSVGAPTLL